MIAQRPRFATEAGILPFGIAQRKFFAGFKITPLGLLWNAVQHPEHRVILAKNAANGSCGMNAQRLEFSQQKKPKHMVEIGIGQRYTGDGRVTHALARMQFRRGFDLCAQIGRSAQQEPQESVIGDCNLSLAARLAVERAGSHRAAIMAGTIPLWKRASGCRAKNFYLHHW